MSGVYLRRAKVKRKFHEESVKSKSYRNMILSIMNVAFVSFAGVANNIVTIVGSDNKVFNSMFSVILYGSLLVTGVQKYFNYDEAIEQHRVSAILYAALCQNIEDESIPVQYIRSQYQLINAIGPSCPEEDEEERVTSSSVEYSRDVALDFEMSRMNR